MSITLRPYQIEIINQVRASLAHHKGVLVRSSTGSGKTAICSEMVNGAIKKGNTFYFIVHREELIQQSSAAFLKNGISHSFIAANYPYDPKARVQICSAMTLVRRLNKYPIPKIVAWDECQYMAANTWATIFKAYESAYHIGLTATPWRLDKKGFREYFSVMVEGPSTKWLIDNKYLSDYKLFAPTQFDSSKLKTQMGDYKASAIEESLTPKIVGEFYTTWAKHAFNKKTIAFAPTVSVSKNIVNSFLENGVNAAHVDAETPKDERRNIILEYAKGNITLLSNVKLFTEGFDVPSIECVMLTRPTKSLALYLQMVGRALRPEPNKTHAIILDQVNVCTEHGLPDDNFNWSLDDRPHKQKAKQAHDDDLGPVKICENCFAANRSFNLFCENCGHKFEIKPRKQLEQVDGDLSEINKDEFRAKLKKDQGQAKTLEQLIELGKSRGYKNPGAWARHVLKGRMRK